MNKKKYIISYFLVILTLFSIFSQEEVILPADASKEFITLYIHGFLTTEHDYDIFTPSTLITGMEKAYTTVGYFRGEEDSPYKWTDTGFTNFSVYRLTGGQGKGLPEFPERPALNADGTVYNPAFLDYSVNSNKDYKILSDIFMEEIGDFNSGSRYLPEAQRQPFMGLAKCEWVYRNSQSLKDMNLSPEDFNTLINRLLLTGPKFHELLSNADYLLGSKTDGTPLGLPNKLEILSRDYGYTSTQLREIANEFVLLTLKTPNQFRFVAHSMGGMYTMRYISEPAEKYYTRDVGGFYQRNRDYSFTEYLEDIYGINTWPAGGLPAPKARYQSMLAYLKSEVVTAANFTGWDERKREEFIYKVYFRPERQNGVDKVIIQDSPLNGVYGANELSSLASTLFTREGIEAFKQKIMITAVYNIFVSCQEIFFGNQLLGVPGFQWLGIEMIDKATWALWFDGIMIGLSIPLGFTEGVDGKIGMVNYLGIDVPDTFAASLKEQLRDFNPADPPLLWVDVQENSPLVMTYKNAAVPEFYKYKDELLYDVNDVQYYGKVPDTTSSMPVEMHVFSVGGIPIMTGNSFRNSIEAVLLLGIIKYVVGLDFLETILQISELGIEGFFHIVEGISGAKDFGDHAHYMETFLPFLYNLINVKWEPSTALIPESSSSGIDSGRLINPVFTNPNAHVYKMEVHTYGRETLTRMLLEKDPQADVDMEGLVLNEETENIGEKINTEYIMIHGITEEILQYPIQMLKKLSKEDVADIDIDCLAIFDSLDLPARYKDDVGEHLLVWDAVTPFGNKRLRLWKTIQIIKSPDGTSTEFPDLDYMKFDYSAAPADGSVFTRNFFNYTMFGFFNGRTPVTVTVPAKSLYNNLIFTKSANASPDRGLCTAYAVTRNQQGAPVMIEEPMANMTATNYIKVLPVAISNYYPGLNFSFSINGGALVAATPFSTLSGYTDLDAYGAYRQEYEDTIPSLVYTHDGRALIVSPHFKEGYNTVVFRFTDPFGNEYFKNIQLLQMTVPPFIQPVGPSINSYVPLGETTGSFKALDISDGALKPADWFMDADFEITVDGVNVSVLNRDNTYYTVQFCLPPLTDGNHTVIVKTRVYGMESTYGWAFWADGTPPEISFPQEIRFSNQNAVNNGSVLAYIKDTVPFRNGILEKAVDTVLLSELDFTVSSLSGSPLVNVFRKYNTPLGAHGTGFNGWINQTSLAHGRYSLNVKATDRTGNSHTNSTTLVIDNKAPAFSTLGINTRLVNLATDLLSFTYNLELDTWETTAQVKFEIINMDTSEKFELETRARGGMDSTFTLAYFTEGANVFKDGTYCIRVWTVDELGNTCTPVEFNPVVVDRTKPDITDCYAAPFFQERGADSISLNFTINETYDTAANKSQQLHTSVALLDSEGNCIDEALFSGTLAPGVTFAVQANNTLAIPGNLYDGKYFLQVQVTDKHDNSTVETVPFVIEAAGPEITYPAAYGLIDGITLIKGSVTDPRFNNDSSLHHYELYYRIGEWPRPQFPASLAGWASANMHTPAYQQQSDWPLSWGRFPVEGNGVLGYLDTTQLPEGLITILVVAEEANSYRTGSVKTFRILKQAGIDPVVEIIPDPELEGQINTVTLAPDEPLLSASYTIRHAVNNPVDLSLFVQEAASSKIIKQLQYFDLKSNDIKGIPIINTEDKGIFIYKNNTDNCFYLVFKNNAAEDSNFFTLLTTESIISNIGDAAGAVLTTGYNLFEDDHKLLVNRSLAATQSFTLCFSLAEEQALTMTAFIDSSTPNVYIGGERCLEQKSNLTLYPASAYPPVEWDGRDEWGRYVENGIYNIGMEAAGSLGGYDYKLLRFQVFTPAEAYVESISNRTFNPGLPGMEQCIVKAYSSKGAALKVLVTDAQSVPIRELETIPQTLSHNGYFTFSWFGDNVYNQLAPDGIYGFLVTITPADGSAPVIFTVDNIKLDTQLAINPAVRAELLPFAAAEDFNGEQLVSGDTRYQVKVTPEGAYLPDKNLNLTIEAENGTQVVTAYPDLNYVAAFRTNYQELWARAELTNVDLKMEYNNIWGDQVIHTASALPISIVDADKVVVYNIDTNTISKYSLNFAATGTVTFKVDKTMHKEGAWFASSFQRIYYAGIAAHYGKILLGNNYMNSRYVHSATTTRWEYVDYDGEYWTSSQWTIKCTITAHGYFTCKDDYTLANYLAEADAFKIIGPDVTSNTAGTLQNTPYVHKGAPLSFTDFIDDVNISTGMAAEETSLVWRQMPHYYFYYISENYPVLPQTEIARTSYNNLFTSFQEQGNAIQAPYTASTAVERFELPGGFTGRVFPSAAGGVSRVQFFLSAYQRTYDLVVFSNAEDKILLPYPSRVEHDAFTTEHIVGGDASDSVPFTHINGSRTLDTGGTIIPNFHVPLTLTDNKANVYFSEDPRPSLETNILLTYTADSTESNPGYKGEIDLTPLLTLDHPVLATTNVSSWYVKQASCSGLDVSGFYNIALATVDLIADTRITIPGDINLPLLADTKWVLSDDQAIGSDILTSSLAPPDFTHLNKTGQLPDINIASLYPDTLVSRGEKNMFTLDNNNLIIDNNAVIIHPDQGGTYHPEILGIDGLPYQGLALSDVYYAGKGLKRSDTLSIAKTAEPVRKLSVIKGYAAGDINLCYLDRLNTWVKINGKVEQEMDGSFTAYWDISRLNGLYTLRLVSEIPGQGINVDFRDVHIGYLTDTNGKQVVLQSGGGEAQLIFPQDSLATAEVISIDTMEFTDIQKEIVLPDIAPLGKVIKLQPEGVDFSNTTAEKLPQLQFTFPGMALAGIDPLELTIYHITKVGTLIPIPTIKLVYNAYDEIIWSSKLDPEEDFPADFAYVKAYSVLTHFSYYMIMEAKALETPVIRDYAYSGNCTISLAGIGSTGRTIEVYVSDSPILDRNVISPVADIAIPVAENGSFSITAIPLLYEGTNYIFTGYLDDRSIKPGRIVVSRDTTPPLISATPSYLAISPNNDDSQDDGIITLCSSETGLANMQLVDANNNVVLEVSMAIAESRETSFAFDGRDQDANFLPEGVYSVIFTVLDEADNSAVNSSTRLCIDLTIPQASVTVTPATISSANQDGFNDKALFTCNFNEPVMVNGWICSQANQDQKKIIAHTTTDSSLTIGWDGRNSTSGFVADNTYYLKLECIDQAGNRSSVLYTDTPLLVDNTAPVMNLLLKDNTLLVVPGEYTIPFTINESSVMDFEVLNSVDTVVYNNQSVFETGAHTVVWYADLADGSYRIKITMTDAVKNKDIIVRNIEVTHDNIPPVLTVPADITIEATGILTPVAIGESEAYDISLPITITNDARVSYPLGQSIVLWTATDRYGNTTSEQQLINVEDTTPPVLIVPLDITSEATALLSPIDTGTPLISDLFGVTVSNNTPDGFPVGTTIVTWTALDENGNSTTKQQTITITDTTAPVLTVPHDIVQEATGLTTPVAIGTAQAADIFPVTISHDAPAGFQLGVTSITWTAVDVNGNIVTAVQKVTITDTTQPVLTIPVDLLLESTTIYTQVNFGNALASDIYPVTIIHNAPELFPPGTTEVTWIATDANGNTTSLVQKVRIYRIVLSVKKDTYLSREHRNTNEGANPVLKLKGISDDRPIVAFDIASLPTETLTKATLQLTTWPSFPGFRWDKTSLSVHRLLEDWAEGNGYNTGKHHKKTPGTIPGATWMTPIDPDTSNNKPDNTNLWFGGKFALENAWVVDYSKSKTGIMTWDVTADVLKSAVFGWLLKQENKHHNQLKIMQFYSKEGAAIKQNRALAPQLILEFN